MANNSKNIIVGAGVLYIGADETEKELDDIPNTGNFLSNALKSYQDPSNVKSGEWTHVGYTSEGVDFSFEPDFGEVQVDQLLDVAKIFKQGQKLWLEPLLQRQL